MSLRIKCHGGRRLKITNTIELLSVYPYVFNMPQFYCQQCGTWIYNDMIPMHNIKHQLGGSTGGLQRLANSATPAQQAEGLKYVGYLIFFGWATVFWLSLLEKTPRFPVSAQKNKGMIIGIIIVLAIYLIRKRLPGNDGKLTYDCPTCNDNQVRIKDREVINDPELFKEFGLGTFGSIPD